MGEAGDHRRCSADGRGRRRRERSEDLAVASDLLAARAGDEAATAVAAGAVAQGCGSGRCG